MHPRYILLDKQVIELSTAAINRPDMKGEADIYNRVMPKDNIAAVSFFENRQSGSRIIVVNAHLHWDQNFKDVKVVQVAVLLEQLEKITETYKSWPPLKESDKKVFRFSNGDSPSDEATVPEEVVQPKPSKSYSEALDIPLILCGDFNSLPDSGPYELIANGKLAGTHEDLENRKYGALTRDGISHPFAFESAYGKIGELPFTNYVSNFRGVVDYIWYARNALAVRGLLGKVEDAYMDKVPGFPNVHFPSDHLAIMAEFRIKKAAGE
jgi:CCR4-NOT transcription complex subunit 6